jgi:hypothetical protein
MTELFDAVSTRLKAIFTAHAALELEAEVIARHVQRKATLLKQAAKLEEEGLKDLAAELREHAGGLDPRRPAEATLPLLAQTPATTRTSNVQAPVNNGITTTSTEPAVNGVLPVPTAAPEPPTTANGATSSPTPDNEPSVGAVPVAIPAEPTPEVGTGRGTGRKKSH